MDSKKIVNGLLSTVRDPMSKKKSSNNIPLHPQEIIKDYRLAYQSRQASIIGRREVLSGKASASTKPRCARTL